MNCELRIIRIFAAAFARQCHREVAVRQTSLTHKTKNYVFGFSKENRAVQPVW